MFLERTSNTGSLVWNFCCDLWPFAVYLYMYLFFCLILLILRVCLHCFSVRMYFLTYSFMIQRNWSKLFNILSLCYMSSFSSNMRMTWLLLSYSFCLGRSSLIFLLRFFNQGLILLFFPSILVSVFMNSIFTSFFCLYFLFSILRTKL